MKTTTTREYDDEGRLVRETTVTDDITYMRHPGLFPTLGCTCGRPWGSVTAPPPCPIHGHPWTPQIICASNVTMP